MTDRLFPFLRQELELSPQRWRGIGRIVIACAIATTLVMTLRIPEGSWLILTIFIVSMPNVGASLIRVFQRQLATTVGALVAIFVAIAFPQQPWFLVPTIGLVIAVAVYLSRTSAAPSIPILGALTMILSVGGLDIQSPEGIHIALWRFVGISTGNVIGSLCQAFIWPTRPENLLVCHLAESLRFSRERMGQALVPLEEVVTDRKKLAESEERVMNSLAQWITWLENATHSGSSLRNHHQQVVNLIGDVNQVAVASQQIARAAALVAGEGQELRIPAAVEARIHETQERCSLYADAIGKESWSSDLDALPPLVPEIHAALVESDDPTRRVSGLQASASAEMRAAVQSSVVSIAEALDSMHRDIDFLRPENRHSRVRSRTPLFQKERSLFSRQSFSEIQKTDVIAAAKASLAAMIAYVYLNAIEWPGGITAVVTALLVSLDNYGAMILKGALRLAGALVGGLLSLLVILYVIPEITSLAPFLVVTSVIFGLAAWVQTGTVRIAYAGLQLAFAASLLLIDTHYPSIDLLPFRNRILGIFTGLAIMGMVYSVLGEIRARVWALDNCRGTLMLMAREAAIGLRGKEAPLEAAPAYGYRYEVYRRISFGYKLLTEASYEDWFSRNREKTSAENEGLRVVIDRIRAIQRVTMSIVWNRLEFQKHSLPQFPGRKEVEAVGKALPGVFETIAARMEHVNEEDPSGRLAVEEYSARLRQAERALVQYNASGPTKPIDPEIHHLLGSQVGFYQLMERLLVWLAEDTHTLHVTPDRFSLAARLHGSERRTEAPRVRPA